MRLVLPEEKMSSYSLALDVIALVVIVGCGAYYAYKGFVSGLLSFFGALIAIVAASFIAKALATPIFDVFFRPGLEAQVAEAIREQGMYSVSELITGILSFLPKQMVDSIVLAMDPSLDMNAADLAAQMVEQVLKPIILPFISIVLFVILFSILRALFGLVAKLARGVTRLPGINMINTVLGAGMGVLVGFLYVFLGLCIIWFLDAMYPQDVMKELYFSKSFVFQMFSGFNFLSRMT